MSKQWNVYLSGEIHSDWRMRITEGAKEKQLPVSFYSPIIDHDASDNCGVEILGEETREKEEAAARRLAKAEAAARRSEEREEAAAQAAEKKAAAKKRKADEESMTSAEDWKEMKEQQT